MGLRSLASRAIAAYGKQQRLPEWGISERIAPRAQAAVDNRPQWQKEGYRDENEWRLNNGLPIEGGQYDPGLLANQQGTTIQAQQDAAAATASGGGGSGTAAGETTPDIVYLNGIAYDLNNEGDRDAFYQLKSAEIDKQLTQALQTGQLSYAKQLASIQDQMTQYMHDWTAEGETLGKEYNQGI
jgi:hypothetical protein